MFYNLREGATKDYRDLSADVNKYEQMWKDAYDKNIEYEENEDKFSSLIQKYKENEEKMSSEIQKLRENEGKMSSEIQQFKNIVLRDATEKNLLKDQIDDLRSGTGSVAGTSGYDTPRHSSKSHNKTKQSQSKGTSSKKSYQKRKSYATYKNKEEDDRVREPQVLKTNWNFI